MGRSNTATTELNHYTQPLYLQRIVGNQAVQRMLKSQIEQGEVGSTKEIRKIHAKLPINQPEDVYEQEANQAADQIMLMKSPLPSSPSQAASLNSTEKTLEPEDRRFFESRFHQNFSDVRVHTDSESNASALDLQARAYTLGNHISFAAGEYRPGTEQGRYLLAHELMHVVQQRNSLGTGVVMLQRQPGSAPSPAPPKQKTLDEAGVSVEDPVYGQTARLIDEVILRNQRLAPYIGGKLKSGFRIAGKFKQEVNDNNFENEHQAAFGSVPPKHVLGFYNPKTSVIHLRSTAKFGTALHEAVHKLASPALYSNYLSVAQGVSGKLVEVLKEGVTAYFTDLILHDEGLPNFNDAYRNQKQAAETLVRKMGDNGFELLATFNFKGTGIIEIGKGLGLSEKQFQSFGGRLVEGVFRKMSESL